MIGVSWGTRGRFKWAKIGGFIELAKLQLVRRHLDDQPHAWVRFAISAAGLAVQLVVVHVPGFLPVGHADAFGMTQGVYSSPSRK